MSDLPPLKLQWCVISLLKVPIDFNLKLSYKRAQQHFQFQSAPIFIVNTYLLYMPFLSSIALFMQVDQKYSPVIFHNLYVLKSPQMSEHTTIIVGLGCTKNRIFFALWFLDSGFLLAQTKRNYKCDHIYIDSLPSCLW